MYTRNYKKYPGCETNQVDVSKEGRHRLKVRRDIEAFLDEQELKSLINDDFTPNVEDLDND